MGEVWSFWAKEAGIGARRHVVVFCVFVFSVWKAFSYLKALELYNDSNRSPPTRGFCFKQAVVMDVGSGWTKMGLAGEDKPSCVFPSVVGRVDLRQYDRISGQVIGGPFFFF